MSGFEFYVACDACGLASPQYPYRYDAVVGTTTIELPVVDARNARFSRVSIPTTRQVSAAELADVAAQRSSADVAVCVPYFSQGETGIEVRPNVACPRCGQLALQARFGRAR